MRRLMFLLALCSLSWGKDLRFGVFLLDSSFNVKVRIETDIQSNGLPDSIQILSVANSNSNWQHAKLNTTSVGDVWLAYEPPSDPGSIIFVSNTNPPVALLSLHIDAMCGGCFSAYKYSGTVVPISGVSGRGLNLKITDLENKFSLGKATSTQEKSRISEALESQIFEVKNDSVEITVLNLETGMPSKDGIQYIAYFSAPTSSSRTVSSLIQKTTRGSILFSLDILGRSHGANPPFWISKRIKGKQIGPSAWLIE